MEGGSYHLFQKLTEFHPESGYVKRNAIDLSAQLMSVQEENQLTKT